MKVTGLEPYIVRVRFIGPTLPYVWSGGERTGAESLLIALSTDEGIDGWGETSPPLPSGSTKTLVKAVYSPLVVGEDPFEIGCILEKLSNLGSPEIAAGIEMALWDIVGKATGLPLCRMLGGPIRDRVPLAGCMGIKDPEDAARTAREYVAQGFHTVKTKGGRDAQWDIEVVRAIREAVRADVQIRLDANQGYTPDQALRLLRDLEPYDLQFFEQPCRKALLEETAQLRLRARVPIALDEGVDTTEELLRAVRLASLDVAVVDIPPAGGVLKVRDMAAIAEAAGIPLVMGSAHEMGVKTAAMLHIVASIPAFRYASDSTYYAQQNDVLTEPLRVWDGTIEVPMRPGLGVEVDREKVRACEMSGASRPWRSVPQSGTSSGTAGFAKS